MNFNLIPMAPKLDAVSINQSKQICIAPCVATRKRIGDASNLSVYSYGRGFIHGSWVERAIGHTGHEG